MKLAAVVPALFVLISLCGSPVPAPPGSGSGVAFYDANRNGIHDSCDSPLPNVAVSATAANGKTAQATSGDDGTFKIEHAPSGDDRLTLVPGEGFLWPMTTTASDGTPGLSVHVDELQDTPGVEIGSASRTAFDASQVSISGIIYYDHNANGVIDKDECGIPDANVDQVQTDPTHAAPLFSDGTYQLLNLPSPGPVSVSANPAASSNSESGDISNWMPTTATLPDSASSCGPSVQPVQRYGPTLYEANIGFTRGNITSSFTGELFDDANSNGVRDAGEAGVPGVELLLNPNDTGCGLSGTSNTTTDAAGQFEFKGVQAGSYQLAIPQKSGGHDSQIVSLDYPPHQYTVAPTGLTADIPARIWSAGYIDALLFDDNNDNGQWDNGEHAAPKVDVCLYNAPLFVSPCTTSDATGHAVFGPVPTGNYLIQIGGGFDGRKTARVQMEAPDSVSVMCQCHRYRSYRRRHSTPIRPPVPSRRGRSLRSQRRRP